MGDGTNLANGTVTSHDTLKEIGDVSNRKKKQQRGKGEPPLPSTIELQLAPLRPKIKQ